MDILRRPAGTMMAALVLSILYGVIRTEKLEIMLDIWALFGIFISASYSRARTCSVWFNRWFAF